MKVAVAALFALVTAISAAGIKRGSEAPGNFGEFLVGGTLRYYRGQTEDGRPCTGTASSFAKGRQTLVSLSLSVKGDDGQPLRYASFGGRQMAFDAIWDQPAGTLEVLVADSVEAAFARRARPGEYDLATLTVSDSDRTVTCVDLASSPF